MLVKLSDNFQKLLKENLIGLCYNPEFIALGSVVKDMLNPDFILIGAYSKKSEEKLAEIYQVVNGKDIAIKAMSIISAEITKISINTFLTLKISYANTIGLLCNEFDSANKFDVCEAIGSDSRIGNKFLLPGLGFGGPCLPRDNRAFAHFAKAVGLEYNLGYVTDGFNNEHAKSVCDYWDTMNSHKLPYYFEYITYKRNLID